MDINIEDIAHIDLYNMLKINKGINFSIIELKKRYRKLSAKYHPDKHNGNSDKFEWIQLAYGILSNQQYREKYDQLFKLYKQSTSSYNDIKNQFNDYNKTNIDDDKDEKLKEFNKKWNELNEKHKVITGNVKDIINNDDINKQMSELLSNRSIPTIKPLISPSNFSNEHFNSLFDKLKQNNNSNDSNNIDAISLTSQYAGLAAFDDLYTDKMQAGLNDNMASLNEAFNIITDIDINNNIDNNQTNYKTHNYKDNDYNKSLQNKIQEYKNQTNVLHNLSMSDYTKDNLNYGILDKIYNEPNHLLQDN